MKYTVALPQSNRVSDPAAIRDVAQAADELGFWALSMHDHVTFDGKWIACGTDDDEGVEDLRNVYEPLVTYAHVSAITKRVRFLFSIMLLPAREPIMTAKQLATLDQLSGGRVSLGIGVGLAGNDSDPAFLSVLSANATREWAALDVPVRRRGKLTDERIAAMQALWTEDEASYVGEFLSFTDVAMYPKPTQPGGPPILIAGNSPAALKRIARGGFTWLPNHAKPEEIAGGIVALKQLHNDYGTNFSGDVVLDLFMRLDDSTAAAEDAFPRVLKESLGAELGARNLIGNPADVISRIREYSESGVTTLDMKPIYRSIPELLKMMETFAREVMPETN
ncbi:LLM class flavin-dependent oxidoreductase [Rhodococcus sp. ACPA1]|uniref:LLM class flavin-dependent oxidoreductase n=1 Tax=Rhodococcus sp. ACPA1 TaxID=2028572 RepID=UPI0015CDE1FF|nr:LLM class flavin-dependent oxidoreductase [Rhodococcus sp. ACPA1]